MTIKLSIMLACMGNREELTKRIITNTINNSGLPREDVELLVYDNGMTNNLKQWLRNNNFHRIIVMGDKQKSCEQNIGSPKAMNHLIQQSKGDYIAKIDDDVLMCENWSVMAINAIEKIPNSGLVGFRCVQDLGQKQVINGIEIHVPEKVFTNWVFSREVFLKVGYFCTLTKYGIWDSDYNYRTRIAGFLNYYIGTSKHLGGDLKVKLTSELKAYREHKTKQLLEAANLYGDLGERYKSGFYLTYDQEIK